MVKIGWNMKYKNQTILSMILSGLLLFLVLFGLNGCNGRTEGQPLKGSVLGMAPLPNYKLGSTFVYSDGTWETVKKIDGTKISWVNYRGRPSTGDVDFTYNRTKWRSSKRKGERWFETDTGLFGGTETDLWPLQAGNSRNFSEFGRSVPRKDAGLEKLYDNYWRCSVAGAERVSVASGTFDSWKISCIRYSDNSGVSRKRPREYRDWYYAPLVNHWVLETRRYVRNSEKNRRKELVAVMPDLTRVTKKRTSLNALKKQFQNALEHKGMGVAEKYTDPEQQLQVSVTPGKTLKHTDGTICRQYKQQIISADDVTRNYFGIACREQTGAWKIPRR